MSEVTPEVTPCGSYAICTIITQQCRCPLFLLEELTHSEVDITKSMSNFWNLVSDTIFGHTTQFLSLINFHLTLRCDFSLSTKIGPYSNNVTNQWH